MDEMTNHQVDEINELVGKFYNIAPSVAKKFGQLSAYEGTKAINKLAGNEVATSINQLRAQCNLIQSELDETSRDGVDARDRHEIEDGICDILFTALGLAARANFDADKFYHQVIYSNMSKFDTDEDDALRTKQKYLDMGIETTYQEAKLDGDDTTYYVTRSSQDQTDSKGKAYPKNKWLKSVNFVEPSYVGSETIDPTTLV